jgi:hypothetical protein
MGRSVCLDSPSAQRRTLAAIADSNDITALKTRSTFRLQYNVSAEIHAPEPDGTATRFQMTEEFCGIMLPLIAPKLPDFGPIFERYAADLKAESEK